MNEIPFWTRGPKPYVHCKNCLADEVVNQLYINANGFTMCKRCDTAPPEARVLVFL